MTLHVAQGVIIVMASRLITLATGGGGGQPVGDVPLRAPADFSFAKRVHGEVVGHAEEPGGGALHRAIAMLMHLPMQAEEGVLHDVFEVRVGPAKKLADVTKQRRFETGHERGEVDRLAGDRRGRHAAGDSRCLLARQRGCFIGRWLGHFKNRLRCHGS